MIVNQLIALDVQLNKQDSYKYFSMENNMFTWMDHIISTEYDADSVKCCDIVELQAGNLSDNLPIHIKFCYHCHVHPVQVRLTKVEVLLIPIYHQTGISLLIKNYISIF